MKLEIEKPNHKYCCGCKSVLPFEAFNRDRSSKYGLMSYCKNCKFRKHYGDQEKKNAYMRQYSARRRAYYKEIDLKDKHGITQTQYDELLTKQGGLCAICHQVEVTRHRRSVKPWRLSVDHDYKTGKIRGLLCTRCNPGLGFFRDDPLLLVRAAQYLREYT